MWYLCYQYTILYAKKDICFECTSFLITLRDQDVRRMSHWNSFCNWLESRQNWQFMRSVTKRNGFPVALYPDNARSSCCFGVETAKQRVAKINMEGDCWGRLLFLLFIIWGIWLAFSLDDCIFRISIGR